MKRYDCTKFTSSVIKNLKCALEISSLARRPYKQRLSDLKFTVLIGEGVYHIAVSFGRKGQVISQHLTTSGIVWNTKSLHFDRKLI